MKTKHLVYFLVFIVALLVLLGVSFLAVLSAPASLKNFGTTNHYWLHQVEMMLLLGVPLFLLGLFVPLKVIREYSFSIFVFLLALSSSVILLGRNVWGATRWLSLFGQSLQPAEFLKLGAIIYLAAWLRNKIGDKNSSLDHVRNQRTIYTFKNIFLPFLIYLGVLSIIFILQPNISMLGIIALTSLVVYFCAGTPIWHSLSIVGFGLSSLAILINFKAYRLARFLVFLDPTADPLGMGFQMNQSLIAIGSGGLGGHGLGMSLQKFGFLPQTISDSAFAIFAEETGFVGCVLLVALFLAFLWAGLTIARRSEDRFGQLAAVGITFWILFQGFVNMSAMMGLMPLTGVPLPFISYGGSHIIAEFAAVGLLLNIARNPKG